MASAHHNMPGTDRAPSYSRPFLPDVCGRARGYQGEDRPRLCTASQSTGNTWPERLGPAPPPAPRKSLAPVCSVGNSNEGTHALAERSSQIDDQVGLKTNHETPRSKASADEATAAWSMSLKTRLRLTDQQVSAILSSRPAILGVSGHDLLAKIEALTTLLGGTETELGAIIAQQPHLLLADVDDRLREKVKWLSDIGLAPADVRSVLASYSPFLGVDLDAMVGGISFLGDELDLFPQDIAKVIVGKPSILTASKADELQPRLRFYFDVLRMPKDQVRLMVLKDPTFLRLSVANLNAKMLYFMEELGLRRLQLTKLMKEHSHVLGLSVDDKLRLNVAYLEHELGIPRNRVKRVIMALPSLLSYSVDDVLRPKVKWLMENLLLEEHQLRKIVTRHPQILSLSVNNNLVPKVSWLQETFGVSDVALRAMVTKNPSILLYNTETSIKRKMAFFIEDIGIAEAQVLKIVIRSPILLSYSTESMRGKASYLKERLRLGDKDVSSLIARSPQIMGYGTAAIESKVVFLMQALHATREEACGIVFKYPQVLNLSIEKNLKKKIDYYGGELNGSKEDVRDAVLGSPTLLGYSLSKRLNPRVKVMRSINVKPNFAEHVWLINSYTELRFSKWVEKVLIQKIGADGRGDTEIRSKMKVYRAMLKGTSNLKR